MLSLNTHHAISTRNLAIHTDVTVRVDPRRRTRTRTHPPSPHRPTPIHSPHSVHTISSTEVAVHPRLLLLLLLVRRRHVVPVQLHSRKPLHDLIEVVRPPITHVASRTHHNSRTDLGRVNRSIGQHLIAGTVSVTVDVDVVRSRDLVDQGDRVGVTTLGLVSRLSLDELERSGSSEGLRGSTTVTGVDVADATSVGQGRIVLSREVDGLTSSHDVHRRAEGRDEVSNVSLCSEPGPNDILELVMILMKTKVVHQHQGAAIELSINLQLFRLLLAPRRGDTGI